jgi:hypothetical protein
MAAQPRGAAGGPRPEVTLRLREDKEGEEGGEAGRGRCRRGGGRGVAGLMEVGSGSLGMGGRKEGGRGSLTPWMIRGCLFTGITVT